MIYRGPYFLSVIWIQAHPVPPFPSASCLSFSVILCVACRAYCLMMRMGARRGGGSKSCDNEKVWTSINQSILSEHNTVCALGVNLCVSGTLFIIVYRAGIGIPSSCISVRYWSIPHLCTNCTYCICVTAEHSDMNTIARYLYAPHHFQPEAS
jgi:hypothetical protein